MELYKASKFDLLFKLVQAQHLKANATQARCEWVRSIRLQFFVVGSNLKVRLNQFLSSWIDFFEFDPQARIRERRACDAHRSSEPIETMDLTSCCCCYYLAEFSGRRKLSSKSKERVFFSSRLLTWAPQIQSKGKFNSNRNHNHKRASCNNTCRLQFARLAFNCCANLSSPARHLTAWMWMATSFARVELVSNLLEHFKLVQQQALVRSSMKVSHLKAQK